MPCFRRLVKSIEFADIKIRERKRMAIDRNHNSQQSYEPPRVLSRQQVGSPQGLRVHRQKDQETQSGELGLSDIFDFYEGVA